MNCFSFILIIIIIYFCVKNFKNPKAMLFNFVTLTIVIETFIEMGYFIQIGNMKIAYKTICEILVCFISIICLIKYPIKKNIFRIAIVCLCAILLGICNLIINPADVMTGNGNISWDDMINGATFERINFNSFVIQEFMQFLFFVIGIVAIYSIFEKEDYKNFILVISKTIKIMFIVGIIEIIIKYIFNSSVYNDLCNAIFGISDATRLTLNKRGEGYILQGLTKEASHYAYTLMISLIILFANYKIVKKGLTWIIIGIAMMIMSMSFSSILFLFYIIFVYTMYRLFRTRQTDVREVKWILLTFFIFIVGFVLIINASNLENKLSDDGFWQRRIKSAIQEIQLVVSGEWRYEDTSLEWSNRVRILSAYETIKLIKYRPLLGLGYASVTSHGSTTMLLAGTGIIGTISWVIMVCFSNEKILDRVNKKYYILAIVLWLMINCLNSLGLRPFYEFTTIVLIVSLAQIFSYEKEEVIQ